MANLRQDQLPAATLPLNANTFWLNGQDNNTGDQKKFLLKDIPFADVKTTLRGTGTGVIKSFGLALNADNTKVNIGRVIGQIIDQTDPENPTVTNIDRAASTGHLSPYIATHNVSYVAINSSGSVVFFPSPLTNSQHRSHLSLGLIAHVNRTNISVVNNEPTLCYNTCPASQDARRNEGTLNMKNGNQYSANTGGLNLIRSAGWLQGSCINAFTNPEDPDLKPIAAETTVSNVLKVFSDNSNALLAGTSNETMNPNIWENIAGVGAGLANEQSVPVNKWTNQLVVMFREGRTNIQVGQKLYNSKAEALDDIGFSSYVVAPVIQDLAAKVAVLSVKQGITNFSDPATFHITHSGTPHGITP